MKVWIARDNQKVSVWHFDDKPKILWLRKDKFFLRGNYGSIEENYGKDTEIEKRFGRLLKNNEVVQAEWEPRWMKDVY